MTTQWALRNIEAQNEAKGKWVRAARDPSWRFLVARLCDWNADYQRAIVRISQQPAVVAYLERSKAKGYELTDDDRALDKLMQVMAFGEGCIRGWEGVTGPDGASLEFTPENVTAVLSHFPDILAQLRTFASIAANYQAPSEAVQGELALGNSPLASNSSGVNGAMH